MIYCKRWQAKDANAQCGAWRKALLRQAGLARALQAAEPRAGEGEQASKVVICNNSFRLGRHGTAGGAAPPLQTAHLQVENKRGITQYSRRMSWLWSSKHNLECSASVNARLGAPPHVQAAPRASRRCTPLLERLQQVAAPAAAMRGAVPLGEQLVAGGPAAEERHDDGDGHHPAGQRVFQCR